MEEWDERSKFLLLFVNNVYSPVRLQTIIMFCSLHKWHSRKHLVEQSFITTAASVLMELMHMVEVQGEGSSWPLATPTRSSSNCTFGC